MNFDLTEIEYLKNRKILPQCEAITVTLKGHLSNDIFSIEIDTLAQLKATLIPFKVFDALDDDDCSSAFGINEELRKIHSRICTGSSVISFGEIAKHKRNILCIDSVIVNHALRGKGLGSKLVKEALNVFMNESNPVVFLSSKPMESLNESIDKQKIINSPSNSTLLSNEKSDSLKTWYKKLGFRSLFKENECNSMLYIDNPLDRFLLIHG